MKCCEINILQIYIYIFGEKVYAYYEDFIYLLRYKLQEFRFSELRETSFTGDKGPIK